MSTREEVYIACNSLCKWQAAGQEHPESEISLTFDSSEPLKKYSFYMDQIHVRMVGLGQIPPDIGLTESEELMFNLSIEQ